MSKRLALLRRVVASEAIPTSCGIAAQRASAGTGVERSTTCRKGVVVKRRSALMRIAGRMAWDIYGRAEEAGGRKPVRGIKPADPVKRVRAIAVAIGDCRQQEA